jgi:hypothetical protein
MVSSLNELFAEVIDETLDTAPAWRKAAGDMANPQWSSPRNIPD